MKRSTLVILALAVLGAAGSIFGLWRSEARHAMQSPTARRATPGCRFSGHERLAYQLLVSTELSAEGSRGALSRMEGRLSLAPLRQDGGGWIVAGVFEPDSAATQREELARTGFLVKLASTCRFEQFAYLGNTTTTQARRLEGLMRTFEAVFPMSAPAPEQWSETQRDENGSFLVGYQTGQGGWGERTPLQRKATHYLPGHSKYVRILEAHADLMVLDGTPWVESVRGDSSYEVQMLSSPMEVSVHYSLESRPFQGEEIFAQLAWDQFRWGLPKTDSAESPVAVTPGLGDLPGEPAYARALALFDADSNPARDASLRYLVDWLKTRPGASMELLELIRAGRVDKRIESLLFLALREANTVESRKGLIMAMDGDEFSPMNRERAAIALGGLGTPHSDAAEALARRARASGGSNEERGVGEVALRSLGRLANENAPGDVKEIAHHAIDEALATREPATVRAAVDAIGNSADTNLVDRVARQLDTEDPRLRGAAAWALRGMGSAEAQPLLAARLLQEKDPEVQKEIADALLQNTRGAYGLDAVRAAIMALAQVPEPQVRASLIKLLGEAAATQPEAKAGLMAWLPREPAVELVQLSGRFLSLEDIRKARTAR